MSCAGKSDPMPRSIFERFARRDVEDLIAEYPLAWVNGVDGHAEHASLLPLLLQRGAGGGPEILLGHMARTNPLVSLFDTNPKALILFRGPQAYVGPAQAGRRDWVPTWNYAQVRIEASITLLPEMGDAALRALVDHMESREAAPWAVEETGPRYQPMVKAIIAFEARIERVAGKFKLGQDETPETLHHILDRHPDESLTRWMRRMNSARL